MNLAKFIADIPSDKKSHLILGLIVNPVLFIFSIVLFNSNFLGLLACLAFHAFVEVYQFATKTGKFEILDFFAGSYSAVLIYLIISL